MLFILLVAFSALFVAGCAAFFSIKGLVVLFSGSALAVGIMASSLEIGKLVAASFLHTYWSTMSKLLRLYLCLAVFVLMCVTSLGIFGFLSGAYQVHSSTTASVETKIETLVHEKSAIDQSILEQNNRIKLLAEIRAAQEERVKTAGNYKAPRDAAYKAIAEANEETAKKEETIVKYRERVVGIDQEISALKISLNDNTDIGSFRFIAGALNTKVDTAVKYFIFVLMAVFDPLAVALVLCWNKLVENRRLKREADELELAHMLAFDDTEEIVEDSLKKKAEIKAEEVVEKVDEPQTIAEPAQLQEKETETIAEPAIKKNKIPKDSVSNMPIGDAPTVKLAEFSSDFLKLSEKEQRAERARINRILGKHNSVVDNS
jgi:hypothetical protein